MKALFHYQNLGGLKDFMCIMRYNIFRIDSRKS